MQALFQVLSGQFSPNQFHMLALEKGFQWPLESIVPMLDAFRLGLLNQDINSYFCLTSVSLSRLIPQ
jgi:hypothetical protein